MHPKLNKTIIVLHIMAVMYFLVVLAVIVFLISFSLIVDEMEPEIPLTFLKITALFTVLLSIASGVFIEIVIKNLKNNNVIDKVRIYSSEYGTFWAYGG